MLQSAQHCTLVHAPRPAGHDRVALSGGFSTQAVCVGKILLGRIARPDYRDPALFQELLVAATEEDGGCFKLESAFQPVRVVRIRSRDNP